MSDVHLLKDADLNGSESRVNPFGGKLLQQLTLTNFFNHTLASKLTYKFIKAYNDNPALLWNKLRVQSSHRDRFEDVFICYIKRQGRKVLCRGKF